MKRSDNSRFKNQEEEVSGKEPTVQITTIPVMEEKLRIEKKNIKKGTLRIHKKIIEEKADVNISVEEEELDIAHRAVNQYVDTPPGIRQEGETTIVPVMREVFEKRLLLVEELHITKRKVKKNFPRKVSLRKEKINIEHRKEPVPDFPENKN